MSDETKPPVKVVWYRRCRTKHRMVWRFRTADGELLTTKELSERCGLTEGCLVYRAKTGMPCEELLKPSATDTGERANRCTALDVPFDEDPIAKNAVEQANVEYAQGRRAAPGLRLHEIADLYGCSRERVRQIEHEALRKLRAKLSGSHLRKMLIDAMHRDASTWDLIEAMATIDTPD